MIIAELWQRYPLKDLLRLSGLARSTLADNLLKRDFKYIQILRGGVSVDIFFIVILYLKVASGAMQLRYKKYDPHLPFHLQEP